jgi:hypothetical protein
MASQENDPEIDKIKAEILSRCPHLASLIALNSLHALNADDSFGMTDFYDAFKSITSETTIPEANRLVDEAERHSPDALLDYAVSTATVFAQFSDMFEPMENLQLEQNERRNFTAGIPVLILFIGYEIGNLSDATYFVDDVFSYIRQSECISSTQQTRMMVAALMAAGTHFRTLIERHGWNQDISIFTDFLDSFSNKTNPTPDSPDQE